VVPIQKLVTSLEEEGFVEIVTRSGVLDHLKLIIRVSVIPGSRNSVVAPDALEVLIVGSIVSANGPEFQKNL